jgi:beta-glucosidase
VDYLETVYVGYKWYETADTMGYWNGFTDAKAPGKTGYNAAVQYPFGYGLSYTTFEWEFFDSGLFTEKDADGKPEKVVRAPQTGDKYFVSVRVVNTGSLPGKEVVQLYANPPYTGGIEKASANLVAFEKTQVLQPGKNEVVTLEFELFDMASYDALNLSGSVGADGGYV